MSHSFDKDYQTTSDDSQFEKMVREQVRIELGKILAEAQKAHDDATRRAQLKTSWMRSQGLTRRSSRASMMQSPR